MQGESERYRKATTGDYDLFGLWGPIGGPKRGRYKNDVRGYERHVGGVDLKRGRGMGRSDPEMGNMSHYVYEMSVHLNDGIKRDGWGGIFSYSGGNMIHHGDEAGRPKVDEIDFPFIAFFPKKLKR